MSHPKVKTTRQLLIAVTILVWAAAIATSAGKFKLSARSAVSISLITKPTAVKVYANNEKLFDGNYIETPRQLTLPSGRSKVKIARDGYISAVFSVDAAPGESINMSDVVLQKNLDLSFYTLEITSNESEDPVHVTVNNGFLSGETPLITDDTYIGTTYILTAYPNWPEKDHAQRCRVRAPSSLPSNDVETGDDSVLKDSVQRIYIKRSAKGTRLNFKGCDRLRSKN